MFGVTNTGDVLNTTVPVPVSSVISAAKLALVGVLPKNVATPVPNPEIPVLTGKFVPLDKLTAEGVPKSGVINTGELENNKLPVPVSSVTALIKCVLVGVAKNVAIPEPKPEIPVDTGNPVALVNTA